MAIASLLHFLEILPHSFVLFYADYSVIVIQIGVTAIFASMISPFCNVKTLKSRISFLSSLSTGVETYVFNPRILETETCEFL